MDPITLTILGTLAAGKAGYGVWQRWKARDMEKKSKGLEGQAVSTEYKQNLSAAERAAREGLPEEAYQNQLNQINSQTAAAGRGLMTRRNTAGQLNNIVANSNRATMGLNAADAQARRANQAGLMSARQIVAQAKQRSYDQEQQAIAALRGAGSQNIVGGLDSFGAGVIGLNDPTGGVTDTPTPRRRSFKKTNQVNPYYPINGIGNPPNTTQNIG